MSAASYEVRLRGALGPDDLGGLDAATCQETGSETVLLTLDIDQQGLHELVTRLRDLGVELLELRQVTGTSSQSTQDEP